MNNILWNPSEKRKVNSSIYKFQKYIEKKYSLNFNSYKEFHKWSSENPIFWANLFEFFKVRFEGDLNPACLDTSFEKYTWFNNVKLNFAENLLSLENSHDKNKTAFIFAHENGMQKKISYIELKSQTAELAMHLKLNLSEGEVLAAYMPNIPQTAVAMLAASSFGAVFTSTSCDFGVEGVVDRFSESNPKVLIAATGYEYNGKYFDQIPKLIEIEKRLPNLKEIILIDFLNKTDENDFKKIPKSTRYGNFKKVEKIEFKQIPFSTPLYIMYSSGTTGKPKCIVHSVGGTLLQHIKELGLHSDLTTDKTILFFTTCGWMMWNWLISSLFFKSTVVLYEGSPTFPNIKSYMDLIDKYNINIFGTGPKFLKALQDFGHNKNSLFESLETVISTGAPLLPEQFDFVYQNIKSDILLGSISGGTDIIGCFMLSNPTLPVIRGEIQCLGLGMDVYAYDSKGRAVVEEEGELVCAKSFPSRPLYFLNDPNGGKMHSAYFKVFANLWHHGDFIKIKKSGGVEVLGRSDATLNPGGVRIGTAEIYQQIEKFNYIADSLCVGREADGDVEVLLFLKMKVNEILTPQRILELKAEIKKNTSPRHVPHYFFPVADIPYTRSGKKMELIVSRIMNKKELKGIEAVVNSECLDEFKTLAKDGLKNL